ncbi:unnamed protein product [Mycena citricolor]|uniref:Nonmuscle myosin heavy chain b n=1 Tax=Mycena citricolor TaxID=2018698 RepID=A0AAD2HDH9_9AGAR|nr:unnamed protein product [Mycena citricolor]
MPAPRPSESAETARAAAAQAEFNEKKWVWVPDDADGYLAGWVSKEDGDLGEIVMADDGEIRVVPLYALSKMNPPKFDRVEDIADLTFLNEPSVVHNLRLRFGSGAIYTYSGLFLVAINPYQSLPLYSDAIVQQYRNKRRDENPPHIFAVAERAWVNMGDERENQSILITGESGAGKTESTKKVIQYLAAIATDVYASHSRVPTSDGTLSRSESFRRGHVLSPSSSTGSGFHTARGRLGHLERQILQANPILEAFGNAQTQRNNNSSRFGKFVRITFAPDGSIAGANIDWYLLEKSRVVHRSEAERSFHVFYQLMVGGGTLKESLLLSGGLEDYEYLNKSRREVDGVDDREEWNTLKNALDTVGFTAGEQLDLFRIIAAILHIGNIVITSSRGDDANMPDPSQVERVCHLLGLPVAEFTRAVLQPRTLAGREWVSQARTRQQALDELGSLCKTLYEKSFGALVDRINIALDRPLSKSNFIGVLDIAGFEIFEINSYEQLLINYTNEKLQQFFNHHMFVLEQEEYKREGIKWDYENFGLDLQATIDLIEASGSTIGILSCLDEECIMPRATDLTFTNKLHGMWAGGKTDPKQHPGKDKYEPTRFDQGFIVHHYAAKVEYRTEGWLEKNKDPLNDNLTRVLAGSSDRYVASLFAEYAENQSSGSGFIAPKKRVKKGAFRTVAQRHKEQLSGLMGQLQATQPHFVRCIVPNSNKKPGRLDVPLVLDQLRCNGVLEGIRIARRGYPNRLPFVEFRQRYEVLTPGIIPRGYMDGREACRRMVKSLELDEAIFKIGTSKIFFKAGVLAELEERRDALLFEIFSRLQSAARMWTARRQMRKILNRAGAIRAIQRNARVYGELREWPWWQLYTKVRPLLAATRNDEEIRKKDAELMALAERAEREKQEREVLETLKASLEAEKRKVEEELEAERGLAIDKDALLDRSKKRESDLEQEVVTLQADLEQVESQLDRAMALQKETDDKHEQLRISFDKAAEHLVRLEAEQKESTALEADLNGQLLDSQQEAETLRGNIDELHKIGEELKNLVLQREEDLTRAKERADTAVKELDAKLVAQSNDAETIRRKAEQLDESHRAAEQQIAEMTRTVSDQSAAIREKEVQLQKLAKDIESMNKLHSEALSEILALQNDIDTLETQLEAEKGDRENETATRLKLEELLVTQKQIKTELDQTLREHSILQETHKSVEREARDSQSQLAKTQAQLSELDKAKRALESDLVSAVTRHSEAEGKATQEREGRERAERQLTVAQSKYHEIEDVMLQMERDKGATDRQLESLRKQLEAESAKRAKLEKAAASHHQEVTQLKEKNGQLDGELGKALNHVKALETEAKQFESKHHTTIVEHVHVLEEAKRVTDRELADAKAEVERNKAYIKSLEKAKQRLTGETEDLIRETERERIELQTKERTVRAQEEKMSKALANADRDRKDKDAAELQARRLQIDLQSMQRQIDDLTTQLNEHRQSRSKLDSDLDQLIDGSGGPQISMARRVAQLEGQIVNAGVSKVGPRFDPEGMQDWRKQKDQMQAKLEDVTRAFEASKAAQTEQRSQIQTLHSQVRELRGVLDDAEADRMLLQKARRALQAELETIKHEHVDASPGLIPNDREFHRLQLKQLDLERALEEQEYRATTCLDRMRKAEKFASECEIELGKVQVEKSELDRLNANLELQSKQLNARIAELENKPTTSTRPAARRESRIEELAAQLQTSGKRW